MNLRPLPEPVAYRASNWAHNADSPWSYRDDPFIPEQSGESLFTDAQMREYATQAVNDHINRTVLQLLDMLNSLGVSGEEAEKLRREL